MTQQPLPESSLGVDTYGESQSGESPIQRESSAASSSRLQSYAVNGPHGRLRTKLLWVNKLLSSDEQSSVSVISLRDLDRALSAFQKEVRVQVLALPDFQVDASNRRSSTRTGPRSNNSVRHRTRNFKA